MATPASPTRLGRCSSRRARVVGPAVRCSSCWPAARWRRRRAAARNRAGRGEKGAREREHRSAAEGAAVGRRVRGAARARVGPPASQLTPVSTRRGRGASGLAGATGGAAGAGGAAAGGTAGGGASGGGPGGSGGTAGVEGTGATAGTGVGGAGPGGGGGQGAGGADGGATPLPSAGCATANAHPSERVIDSTVGLEIRRKFPSAYDGVTPMPLIFALHATNYSASGMIAYLVTDQPMADRYVVVAPQENLSSSAPRTSNHAWRPTFQRCSRTS